MERFWPSNAGMTQAKFTLILSSKQSEIFRLLTHGLVTVLVSSEGTVCGSLCLHHRTANKWPSLGARACTSLTAGSWRPLPTQHARSLTDTSVGGSVIIQHPLETVPLPGGVTESSLHPPPSFPHDKAKCLTCVQVEGTSFSWEMRFFWLQLILDEFRLVPNVHYTFICEVVGRGCREGISKKGNTSQLDLYISQIFLPPPPTKKI